MTFEEWKVFLKDVKDVAEPIYTVLQLIALPVVVYAAYKGLAQLKVGLAQVQLGVDQLKVTRTIATDAAKRDAAKIAIERCEFFAQRLCKDTDAIHALGKKTLRAKIKINVNLETNAFEPNIAINGDVINELSAAERTRLIAFMNDMQAFALYFEKGIADETAAYSSCSNAYINLFNVCCPYFLLLNSNNRTFGEAIRLYVHWLKRAECEKIEIQNNANNNKLKSIKSTPMPVVGVDA